MADILKNNRCQITSVILCLCGEVGFLETEAFRNVTGTREDLFLRINFCLKKFVALI